MTSCQKDKKLEARNLKTRKSKKQEMKEKKVKVRVQEGTP